MGSDETKTDKKKQKAEAKLAKKMAKAEVEITKAQTESPKTIVESPEIESPSVGVRFAETVKGILYVILAVSLVIALILGEGDVVITLEDIINNLIVATIGKVLLALLALALLLYGLKQIRLIK